jgi:hypothetical protein
MITDADIERIAARTAELLRGGNTTPAPVLTPAEARALVKRPSQSAFQRWCSKWGVRSAQQGRYSRVQLERAMAREAMGARRVA